MALLDLNKLLKSASAGINTLKSGGTNADAAKTTSSMLLGKNSTATPTKTTTQKTTIGGAIQSMVNSGLSAFDTIKDGGTPQEALASANKVITTPQSRLSTTSQPITAAPAVDPNMANMATQIQDIMKMLQEQNKPKAVPQYQSQYNDEITGLINQFNNRPKFAFDATNNPTIQAYQKQAADAVTQEMGRRNILNSTITGDRTADKVAEVLATMGPQLEQQAYNQYQDQGQNLLQQIQNYQNLDNNDYSRFVNAYNMGQDVSQQQFNNTASIADMINKLSEQNYNKLQDSINNARQDAELTGLYNPYAGVEVSPEVQKYSSDYSAEINRRRATPDTSDDYLISQLEAAKANKIFSSPDLLEKYGDIYKTPAQKAAEYANVIEQQKLELERDPNSLENQTKLYNLAKIKTELDQLAKYGPQEQELKLQEIKSRISENAASASASYARANQIKNEKTDSTTTGLKYKDYYEAGVEMKNAGTYDDNKNYVPRYNDQQIFTWIDGLPIPSEQKAQLARDIGVSEKVKAVEKVQGPYPNAWN